MKAAIDLNKKNFYIARWNGYYWQNWTKATSYEDAHKQKKQLEKDSDANIKFIVYHKSFFGMLELFPKPESRP